MIHRNNEASSVSCKMVVVVGVVEKVLLRISTLVVHQKLLLSLLLLLFLSLQSNINTNTRITLLNAFVIQQQRSISTRITRKKDYERLLNTNTNSDVSDIGNVISTSTEFVTAVTTTATATATSVSSSSSSLSEQTPSFGLYEVQEQILIDRGIYEEELMNMKYTSKPLLHIEPPTTSVSSSKSKKKTSPGTSMGFGKVTTTSSSSSSTKFKSDVKSQQQQQQQISVYPIEAKHYGTILRDEGLVRIDHVIPDNIIDDMKYFVLALRMESLVSNSNNGQISNQEDRFANVLLRNNRCDLKIPLGNHRFSNGRSTSSSDTTITTSNTPVIEALYNVLCNSPVSETIQYAFTEYYESNNITINNNSNNMIQREESSATSTSVKTGKSSAKKSSKNSMGYGLQSLKVQHHDPILYELSCLISDYGSERQVIHPDNPIIRMGDENNDILPPPILYTCFIALQDILDVDMGPTIFLPQTHTPTIHDLFKQDTVSTSISSSNNDGTEEPVLSPKDQLLRDTPSVMGTLPKGSCVIYDSRLLHCGSANRKIDTNRAIFYFSFRNSNIRYPGNPPSIRSDLYHQQISLRTLQGTISDIYHEKISNPFSY